MVALTGILIEVSTTTYHLNETEPGAIMALMFSEKFASNDVILEADKSPVLVTNYGYRPVMTGILPMFLLVYNGNLLNTSGMIIGCRNGTSKKTTILNYG